MSLLNSDSLPIARLLPALALLLGLGIAPALPHPAVAATAAAAAEPELRPMADKVEANEAMSWAVDFFIVNTLKTGLYYDSLRCDIESLDPPSMGGGRRTTLPLDFILKGQRSVSAGEEHGIGITIPASAERARLTYRLYAHDAVNKRWRMTTVVEALPGPFSRAHPSQFATADGRKVEYVVIEATGEQARSPGPAILYIHGSGSSARQMLPFAHYVSMRGYTVMLASMPGYGQSEGAPDFGGPATLTALSAALDALRRTPGVDSSRIAVWGISGGAAVALNLAARRPDVRATIAQSGPYDLWSTYRGARTHRLTDLSTDIERMAGKDSSAWRERSPIYATDRIKRPVLLVHAEDDSRAPIAAARGLAADLKARGVDVETRFVARGDHQLPQRDAMQAALPFLRRFLTP